MLIITARDPLQWAFGAQYPAAAFGNTRYFEGPRYVFGFLSSLVAFQSVFNAMWCIFTIVGLKRLLKHEWLVGVAAVLVFTFLAGRGLFANAPGQTWINVVVAVLVVGVLTAVAIRGGLLATAACFLATFVISATPWTFDTAAWYFPASSVVLAGLCGLAAFAGYAASGKTRVAPERSRPAWRSRLADLGQCKGSSARR